MTTRPLPSLFVALLCAAAFADDSTYDGKPASFRTKAIKDKSGEVVLAVKASLERLLAIRDKKEVHHSFRQYTAADSSS